MVPHTTKVQLNELAYQQQRRICSCKPVCNEGLSITTYNDGFILCENDARKFLYGLTNQLDQGGTIPWIIPWTEQDEEFIIKHYEENGTYYGFNRYIAKSLKKTYGQVKGKIRRMKEMGLLGGNEDV